MALDAQLQPLTLPSGTEFPGTPQGLLDLIAQYMAITGLNPFNGINYGATTPDAGNRDRPWFQTDASGNPIGWLSWNGSAWTPIPQRMPSGPTAGRPDSPSVGTQYFDTDIGVALVFDRSQWRTLAGTVGDVKFVKAATIAVAIQFNPGWIQDPDSPGRLIGAAGDNGTGLTPRAYGEATGAETTTLTTDSLPGHTHSYTSRQVPRWHADGNAADPAGNLVGYSASEDDRTTGSTGNGTAFSNYPPTLFYWALVKQ